MEEIYILLSTPVFISQQRFFIGGYGIYIIFALDKNMRIRYKFGFLYIKSKNNIYFCKKKKVHYNVLC